MPLKLLAAADLHLGRRPGHLPDPLLDGVSVRELSPAGAWQRLVKLALDEGVSAVLLAGDVVDGDDDFFEAYRELRDGVVRLTRAGIRVLAVAGNHDTKVLPYLADQVEAFELLGREGRWESTTLSFGGAAATIYGWSFPRPWVREDPLSGHAFPRGPGANLGLLHCDRNQPGSRYAPVSSSALAGAGLDGWLLGHIHRPDPLSLPHPQGYLGSLTGLDPGEWGHRGAWLLMVDGGGIAGLERRALGPLRWAREEVGLHELDEPEEARSRLLDRMHELAREVGEADDAPLAVGIRVTFTGRTRFGREVEALLSPELLSELVVEEGRVGCFVESVRVETLPEVDLEELARRGDPAGLLARRVLLLLEGDPGDPARRELLTRGRKRLARVGDGHPWGELERGAPDEDETEEWLRRAGLKALDLLLAQAENR
ncbi:MAG: metallophosphoesterase [Gemmatimonadota bacterium]